MPRNRPIKTLRVPIVFVCAAMALLLTLIGIKGTIPSARAGGSRETQDAQAPPPSACKGILAQPDALKNSVRRVPKYQKTYVLVVGASAQSQVTGPTSPALAGMNVEIYDEPAAIAITQDLHLTKVTRVSVTEQSPVQPLVDLAAGKADAVIMWGPLAGAGIIDLALDDKVSIYSVDRPKNAPAAYGSPETPPDACASAIADDLDSFGVLPAELLVPVNMRSMLGTPTPVFTMQDAELGGQAFEQICARCHGAHAVADKTLAPVDLLVSIRRFQYIGFKYIVLNGRPQKGMPPLRGTVSEDQIALIYQYLVARSKNKLTASSK
jgi:cytochrome c553